MRSSFVLCCLVPLFTTAQSQHTLKVVTLGDSFPSGTGSRNAFGQRDYDTQDPGCYRSDYGFGGLYARNLEQKFENLVVQYENLACFGTSVRMDGMQQIQLLDETVDIVLWAMGANDVHFHEIVISCLVPNLANVENCTISMNDAFQAVVGLVSDVEPLFLALRGRVRADTKLVVVQYPYLVLDVKSWTLDGYNDASEIRRLQDIGDDTYREAVTFANAKIGNEFAVFADTIKDLFAGHEVDPNPWLVNPVRWINEIEVGMVAAYLRGKDYVFNEPFHPNACRRIWLF
jgi:lysophospholipase L1-like esterase